MTLLILVCTACVRPSDTNGLAKDGHETGDTPDTDHTGDSSASGRTLTVCAQGGEYTAIQPAINDANEGDTIRVCSGEYDGFKVESKRIWIIGTGPNATVVVGGSGESAVDWRGDAESSDTSFEYGLSNITITNPHLYNYWAAAIFEQGTRLAVRDVIITNTISGGTVIDSDGVLTLDRVRLSECQGALIVAAHGMTITNSVIIDNTSPDRLIWPEVDISNSIVAFNTGSGPGYLIDGGEPDEHIHYAPPYRQFVNNVVYGNVNMSADAANEPALQLQQTDLYGNVIANNSGAGVRTYGHDLSAGYNLAWNNGGEDFNLDDAIGPGPTDLVADPLFTDPDNLDFTLQPGSPAIDAGNPDAAYNDVDGSRNDIGAFGGPLGDWAP